MVPVATLSVFVEVAEVGGGAFVALGADVAAPAAAVFEPGYKGVHVGSASFGGGGRGSGLNMDAQVKIEFAARATHKP